jgi:colicin import membrane protein
MKRVFINVVACLGLGGAGLALAQQGQSMEERLRAQLRTVTAQLQEAQNEVAMLKAGHAAAATLASPASTAAPEAGRKELAEVREQLAAQRQARQQEAALLRQSQATASKAAEQVAQYRNAYDGLLKIARASEAERQRLAGEEKLRQEALALCAAKNVKLYETGQEILTAYENIDLGTLVTTRQPFATRSRVKYEQIAQDYGDKLYEGRFDARTVTQPPGAQKP